MYDLHIGLYNVILVIRSIVWSHVAGLEAQKSERRSVVLLVETTWLRCCLCIISYDTRKYFVIKKMSHVTIKAVFSFGLIIWFEPSDPTSSFSL